MIIETVVGAVASELLKAMTSEAGKDAYRKGKEILASLRARFAGNPQATEVLSNYERQPERHDAALRYFLVDAARSDSEFARVLEITAGRLAPAHTTTIGTQNIQQETVYGPKMVNTISAGRDVIQGGAAFVKSVDSSE
jgi:hypothetical protein